MTKRLFGWCCPNCDTALDLATGEERDDDARGVDAQGWASFEPRCPNCQTLMVDGDTIAVWAYADAPNRFTHGEVDIEKWRAGQPKIAHASDCEVYDRGEHPCGCGADLRNPDANRPRGA